MEFAALNIDTIVMHEIIKASRSQGATPQLSDVPTPLTDTDRAFIQERVRKALAKYARPIKEDVGISPVPDAIKAHLRKVDADPLPVSQELARRLQSAQKGVSPGGIFVFAEASMDGKRAILIAKLEHEQGVRATPTKLADGNITFGIEFLRDLLFTTASRVFKVALFVADDVTGDLMSGILVDQQMTGSSVAQFFLTDFLGCRLSEQADLLTERFYNGSQAWISTIYDPEKQARYEVALLSELQSQGKNLSANEFASHYLEAEDRDPFVHSLQGAGVPKRNFAKNTTLVKSKIKRLKLDTEGGVTVLTPVERVDDGVVSIEGDVGESARITVTDRLKSFQ
jgi:hypothetical protein